MVNNRLQTQRGFTLLEIMTALMIMVILVSLAVPGYRAYVIRAHRSDGIQALMAAAVCQERVFTRINAYDATQCGGLTDKSYYNITVATQSGNQEFTLTATPQGAQAEDSCGGLSVDQRGVRLANGSGGDTAERCWSGKTYVAP